MMRHVIIHAMMNHEKWNRKFQFSAFNAYTDLQNTLKISHAKDAQSKWCHWHSPDGTEGLSIYKKLNKNQNLLIHALTCIQSLTK
jgi:hypothetical protein